MSAQPLRLTYERQLPSQTGNDLIHGLDISAVVEKDLDNVSKSLHAGPVQGRATQLRRGRGIWDASA